MNEEQALFKQLILSDCKQWNSPAFKTLHHNNDQQWKYYECGVFVSVAYL